MITSLSQSWVSRVIRKIVERIEQQLKKNYDYSIIIENNNVLLKSKIEAITKK